MTLNDTRYGERLLKCRSWSKSGYITVNLFATESLNKTLNNTSSLSPIDMIAKAIADIVGIHDILASGDDGKRPIHFSKLFCICELININVFSPAPSVN